MTELMIPESYPNRKDPIALQMGQLKGVHLGWMDIREDGSDVVDSRWLSIVDISMSSRSGLGDEIDHCW
jgi:hypothetical protein